MESPTTLSGKTTYLCMPGKMVAQERRLGILTAPWEQDRMRAYNAGRSNVERLAAETGGATFWGTKKNYPDAVNAIANQLDGQYMVTFVPGDILGPVHSLKVTSSNGARVLAQKVFFYTAAK